MFEQLDSYNCYKMSKKVKIAHSLQELQDQVILTLVDRPLLQQGKVNLDDDYVLQNQEMQINNQARHNIELKGKLKNVSNAASSHLQAKNQGLSGLLPHYDDYSYKPQTIEVQQGAIIKSKKTKKNKMLGSDYNQNDTSTTRLNSEYKTRKDPKNGAGKTSARDLLSFLDDTAEDNLDSMKREHENSDVIRDSLDQLKKKRILDDRIKNIVRAQIIDDEEESMLLKSIERSRKKAEQQKQKFNMLEAIKEEDPEQGDKQTVQIQLHPIAYQSTESVRKDRNVQLQQVIGGTSSVLFAHLPSERLAHKVHHEEAPVKLQDYTKEELQKMRQELQFLQDREVGIGLAGTLSYLRENALLHNEEQVGRHNDKTVDYNEKEDRIKLQYRNASGQLMKPKQAYRYMCHKFHGEGASKNKVQIRKKRELQDLRMKQNMSSGGQFMKLLEQHQQKNNEAHLVLNLGGKMKQ